MPSQSTRRKILWALLCAVTATALAQLLDAMSALAPIERAAYDRCVRSFPPAAKSGPPIVLLLIDQKSLDYFARESGLGWPWPRDLYAAMLAALNARGARVVAFDILFTEPSIETALDEGLADATASSRVIHAMDARLERRGDVRFADRDVALSERRAVAVVDRSNLNWPRVNQLVPPIDVIEAQAAALGSVRFAPDADGKARSSELFVRRGRRFLPSLAMATVLELTSDPLVDIDEHAHVHVGEQSIPLTRDGRLMIRYLGPERTFPSLSVHALVSDHIRGLSGAPAEHDWSLLDGAIVLVGASFVDLKHTPFIRSMPGVEIHANTIANLLSGDAVELAPPWVDWLAPAVVALAISLLLVLTGRPLMSAAVVLALGGAWFGATTTLFATAGIWLPIAVPLAAAVFALVASSLTSYALEGRQRRFLRRAFEHYLAPQVIDILVDDPSQLRLGGVRREITVFFSDLAGFTSFSERLQPEELGQLLSRYLSEMTGRIMDRQGTLDKFIGDAIMAFWGAPVSLPEHAALACHAALDNVDRLHQISRDLEATYHAELSVRIGLASGPAAVGNMGSEDVFNYTAMGDTVNLASRLEGLNKAYGTVIMASDATRQAAGDAFLWRELDLVAVKGKTIAIRVHELIGRRSEVDSSWDATVAIYADALALYRARRFAEAGARFQELLRSRPDDPPSAIMLERCRELEVSPPPEDWQGELVMKHK